MTFADKNVLTENEFHSHTQLHKTETGWMKDKMKIGTAEGSNGYQ